MARSNNSVSQGIFLKDIIDTSLKNFNEGVAKYRLERGLFFMCATHCVVMRYYRNVTVIKGRKMLMRQDGVAHTWADGQVLNYCP